MGLIGPEERDHLVVGVFRFGAARVAVLRNGIGPAGMERVILSCKKGGL